MDNEVDLSPLLTDRLEYRLDILVFSQIAGQDQFGIETRGQRPNPLFQCPVKIGKSQSGAGGPQLLGDPPGDTHVVGNAKDDSAFSSHQTHICPS